MNNILLMYKNDKRFKLYIDLLFIFILPQVVMGLLFSFPFKFTSFFILYRFLRSLLIISIYIYSYLIIINDSRKIGNQYFQVSKWGLYLYTAISLFLTAFYNRTPYTLISYITERYENLFNFFQLNDPLYNAINYVITGNFFATI